MRILAPLLIVTLIVMLAASCAPALIPGTSVEDSPENRQVLEFLNKYRKAVIEKNLDGVVGLCAEDYFEDNGTVEQKDDYGLAQLRDKLGRALGQTKEIQLEIIVQAIERDQAKEHAPVRVVYRYNQRALVAFPAGEKWITVSDVNRLVLRDDAAGGFLITSGL
ncbi:MAG: hypothetical protein HYS27_20605 [Deltaproteobacteria bacterium]|nr:hypothetical protein [Deltaproteobacteria bacterium]